MCQLIQIGSVAGFSLELQRRRKKHTKQLDAEKKPDGIEYFTKTASIVGSWHTECKSTMGSNGLGGGGGDFCSTINNGGEILFADPKLMLLDSDRFDAAPFSFELNDNIDESTESVSSTGISNFGIVFCLFFRTKKLILIL